MKIRQLKVKVKSLAAEQRIIRHEEVRARRACRWESEHGTPPDAAHNFGTAQSLYSHRIFDVRPEARSANIAYGLLKGRTLEQIETPRSQKSLARKPYREPDWDRIESLLKKYGNGSSVTVTQYRQAA